MNIEANGAFWGHLSLYSFRFVQVLSYGQYMFSSSLLILVNVLVYIHLVMQFLWIWNLSWTPNFYMCLVCQNNVFQRWNQLRDNSSVVEWSNSGLVSILSHKEWKQVGQKLFMGRKVQHMFSCETEIIHGKR